MATIDYNAKEVLIRLGVVGPPGAGKTQVLWRLHAGLSPEMRGELVMRAIGADQLVSFDFTPPDLIATASYRAKCRALAVAGRIADVATFERVMSDLDGVLFVVDSQRQRLGENIAALRQLSELGALGDVPIVLLYNKRDLPNAATVAQLDERLNRAGAPRFATVATTGEGLGPALSEIFRRML